MESAFSSVRYGGGKCILAGNLSAGEKISIDPMDLIRGRKISGSWGGESVAEEDIPRFALQYQRGELQLDRFPISVYPMAKINDAIRSVAEGATGRAIVSMRDI
jgi:S-(hydroxymethyl)glutathione dehydrogenase/alcohol dehydrogenase